MKRMVYILIIVLLIFISFDISYSKEIDPNSPTNIENIVTESEFDKNIKSIVNGIVDDLNYFGFIHDQNMRVVEKTFTELFKSLDTTNTKIERLELRLDLLEGKINKITVK